MTSAIETLSYLEGSLPVSKSWAVRLSGDLSNGVRDVRPCHISDPHGPSHKFPVRFLGLLRYLDLRSVDKQLGVLHFVSTQNVSTVFSAHDFFG